MTDDSTVRITENYSEHAQPAPVVAADNARAAVHQAPWTALSELASESPVENARPHWEAFLLAQFNR